MRVAVVAHVFYPSLWPELADCIRRIGEPKDVFVTYSDEASVVGARKDFPAARFVCCENRGYDIWPFLKVVQDLRLGDYGCIVKLHTKRDIDQDLVMNHAWFADAAWRNYLLAPLKSRASWRRTLAKLRRPGVGMVADRHVIFNRAVTSPNLDATFDNARRAMADIAGVEVGRDEARYVAGTMFVVRPEALEPLLRRRYAAEMFERYDGHERETYAHLMERMFGFSVSAAGLIVEAFNGSAAWSLGYYRQKTSAKMCRFFFQRRQRNWDLVTLVCKVPVRVRKCRRIEKLLQEQKSKPLVLPENDPRNGVCPPYRLKHLMKLRACDREVAEMRIGDLKFYDVPHCRHAADGAARCDWCATDDPRRMPVVSRDDFVLWGCCLCCDRMAAHGPDYRMKVLRIRPEPLPCACAEGADVRRTSDWLERELGVTGLVPIRQSSWKPDSMLFTMFFEARMAATGRKCFVKYVPYIRGSVETEWSTGRAFHDLLPENCAESLGCCVDRAGHAAIAVEYLPGRTLGDLLRDGCVNAETAARLAAEIERMADALQKLRISHRDIGTENLLLADDGHLKLIDFQFATGLDDRGETPFAIRNWQSVLAGLGAEYNPDRGLWNDRYAFARCVRKLPDFDGKEAVCERLMKDAGAVMRPVRLPNAVRMSLFARFVSLSLVNLVRRCRGLAVVSLEVQRFCRVASIGASWRLFRRRNGNP